MKIILFVLYIIYIMLIYIHIYYRAPQLRLWHRPVLTAVLPVLTGAPPVPHAVWVTEDAAVPHPRRHTSTSPGAARGTPSGRAGWRNPSPGAACPAILVPWGTTRPPRRSSVACLVGVHPIGGGHVGAPYPWGGAVAGFRPHHCWGEVWLHRGRGRAEEAWLPGLRLTRNYATDLTSTMYLYNEMFTK